MDMIGEFIKNKCTSDGYMKVIARELDSYICINYSERHNSFDIIVLSIHEIVEYDVIEDYCNVFEKCTGYQSFLDNYTG